MPNFSCEPENSYYIKGMDYKNKLAKLAEFDVGGRGLAIAPISNAVMPLAESEILGGVQSAIDWMQKHFKDGSASGNAFLFLVGAPGNGKSFITKRVVEDLERIGLHDSDRRRYEFEIRESGLRVSVINDATANSDFGQADSCLIDELDEAVNGGFFMHVNVNRGILHKEFASDKGSLEIRELVRWLGNSKLKFESRSENFEVQEPKRDSSIRCARLNLIGDESKSIEIVAVMMDLYSIFEIQPEHEHSNDLIWSGFPCLKSNSKYQITLPDSDERLERTHWIKTPAGQLLAGVIESLRQSNTGPTSRIDPIASNIADLSHDEVFTGILCCMRNVELSSSQHITFRSMWTAIAAIVIGNGDSRLGSTDQMKLRMQPAEWAELIIAGVSTISGEQRLKDLVVLASVRLHQSFFGAIRSPFVSVIDCGVSPFQVMTHLADPVADAMTGNDLRPLQNRGWSSPVIEAFRGNDSGESILGLLIKNAGENGICLLKNDFDEELDKEISFAISSQFKNEAFLSLSELEKLIQWYCEYLTRLYAVQLGITAFTHEIVEWVRSWTSAKNDSTLDGGFRAALINLLLPIFPNQNEHIEARRLVAYLSARAEGVIAQPLQPRLAIEISDHIQVIAFADGDELSATFRDSAGKDLLTMNLDFVLLREALANSDSSNAVTDRTSEVIPKIERFRASIFRPESIGNNLRLVSGSIITRVALRQ